MKVYVDTNILIDLVCCREEFLADAQYLFTLGYMKKKSSVFICIVFCKYCIYQP